METVSVVFCFNDAFCRLATGAISSLINNASDSYNYDIYIIHDDLSVKNQFIINSLNNRDNVSIKYIFFDLNKEFPGTLNTRKKFSHHILFRLFLNKILPNIDKILYLDGDVVITTDISNLFNINISNYSIAAVPEYTVARIGIEKLKNFKIFDDCPDDIKSFGNLYDYFRLYLRFDDLDIDNYFNSGVILFNLKRAGRALNKVPSMLEKNYFAPDQCLLNLLFKDDKLIIDQRYNTFSNHVPEFVEKYGTLPDIIHFYGTKPDKSMSRPGDSKYWEAMYKSSLYYPALEHFMNFKINAVKSNFNRMVEAVDKNFDIKIKDPKTIDDLYHNLKRMHKLMRRRKYIKLIIRLLVDHKKYKKLKENPDKFFFDSKSSFIRFLGKYYE